MLNTNVSLNFKGLQLGPANWIGDIKEIKNRGCKNILKAVPAVTSSSEHQAKEPHVLTAAELEETLSKKSNSGNSPTHVSRNRMSSSENLKWVPAPPDVEENQEGQISGIIVPEKRSRSSQTIPETVSTKALPGQKICSAPENKLRSTMNDQIIQQRISTSSRPCLPTVERTDDEAIIESPTASPSLDNAHPQQNPHQKSNIYPIRAPSEFFCRRIMRHRKYNDISFDWILVDPPRSGLDSTTLKLIQNFEHILYISCNPSALRRDLDDLGKPRPMQDKNSNSPFVFFEMIEFCMLDHFPFTPHIENGVYLRKRQI